MTASARDTAGSASPRSQPFAPGGKRSTYSRTACVTNSSASLATTSDDGCCSARKRIELSSHSACPPAAPARRRRRRGREAQRVAEPPPLPAGDVESQQRRQGIEKRVLAVLRRGEEPAPHLGLRPVRPAVHMMHAIGGDLADLAGVG